ncbi:alkane 1-monooxygenase [Mycobacterium florentinum]|uniref:Alkane 1-monooxygenase n=1 Tax=Mycobacterium florentinum TaxID=292462 RepID=A0A1X1U8J7_MYCFL|nr:LLM class flavin-dependent oxidoreductase [Mycobacterium florentinum]MCV7410618.1 LLM class flavin-dependent oxidoreductase [Mycobacterium florentinum]ORV53136.1 alkane 1-monooxygenase [Mycobacterium florentinum]BBX79942.1 luciferase [Mycobacterium florentinum]
MHFGVLLLLANASSGKTDPELWKEEMELGVRLEDLGYDSVWVPEHHFDRPYCISPDPLQALTYLAAKTSTIKLGTGAIILPWWKGQTDPIRLAERISMLDALSDGRLLLGLGRGLARDEYEGFGVEMSESRERFFEAATMILDGLENGYIDHDGKYYKQIRRDVFPKPERGFRDRIYNIAMSPESTLACGDFGGTMMCFNYQHEIDKQAEQFETWRARFREKQGSEPPPPVLLDFAYCHEDAEIADRTMRNHLAPFYSAMVDHYEFDGLHFGKSKGYESYQEGATLLLESGREAGFEKFYGLQWKGTPEAMIEQMRRRIALIGEFKQMLLVSYGGLPLETVQRSLKLIADEVIPEVNKIAAEAARARTEAPVGA